MSEALKSKKKLATELADELRQLAMNAPTVNSDGGLDENLARELGKTFLNMPLGSERAVSVTTGRGTREYWLDHGELTGALMERIAGTWGGNPSLYNRVGRLHDVDYLAFPHDVVESGARHPLPLARAAFEHGVHPAICLAVLEHAPYIGLDRTPSSRLSAALSAAEDLATLAALRPPSEEIDSLSPEAKRLFDTAVPQQWIHRQDRIRVELDIERYINAPLALIVTGTAFQFSV